jgi:hypothetical protein
MAPTEETPFEPPEVPLRDPWLKFDRAAEHLQLLDAKITEVRTKPDVNRAWVEYEPDLGCHLL